MHGSVMEFGRRHLTAEVVADATVVGLGSFDVNGSLRSHVEPLGPRSYVGVDQWQGPGVDVVSQIEDVADWPQVDIVICTEVLEHAEDWRTVVDVAKELVVAGGLLLVTTRSPGFPFHPHPDDFWRFRLAEFAFIFADMDEVALEEDTYPGHPGVLACYRKRAKRGKTINLAAVDVAAVERP